MAKKPFSQRQHTSNQRAAEARESYALRRGKSARKARGIDRKLEKEVTAMMNGQD